LKHHHIRRLCALEGPGDVTPRATLTKRERATVLDKTAGTCHVCGGRAGKTWQADHIVPHRLGGRDSVENYLPICRVCNRLRRSHSPRVQQLIIRLGTYARREIGRQTDLGKKLIELLLRRHKENRARRERSAGVPPNSAVHRTGARVARSGR
jgi:5-methylcytosine-specific restriction endonuclease McrA